MIFLDPFSLGHELFTKTQNISNVQRDKLEEYKEKMKDNFHSEVKVIIIFTK